MSLSYQDQQMLEMMINESLKRVPPFLKGSVNPSSFLNFSRSIPPNFRNYTLGEIIEALEESVRKGNIK